MKSQVIAQESEQQAKPDAVRRPASTTLTRVAKNAAADGLEDVYQSILWRIDAKCEADETMAVGLIGCQAKSGSSTIVENLAWQAAQQQRGRVLLIDANWQSAGQGKTTHSSGLYDVLSGDVSPRELEMLTVTENLDLMPLGKSNGPLPTHVRSELVEEMLSELKQQYNLILVDLPVAEELRSSLALARHLDGTLLVARFERVKQSQAQRAVQRLSDDGVPVWGTVLNRHREYVPRWLRNWV